MNALIRDLPSEIVEELLNRFNDCGDLSEEEFKVMDKSKCRMFDTYSVKVSRSYNIMLCVRDGGEFLILEQTRKPITPEDPPADCYRRR